MAKWNPFEKNVLNPDPDEFSGEENAGYGIPRDADSEDSFSQDAASSDRPEETGPAQPEDPADTDSQPEELSSAQPEDPADTDSQPEELSSAQPQDEGIPHFEQDPSMQTEDTGTFGAGADPFAQPGGESFAQQGGDAHDFEEEELKFDTQTGERLDRPKKKFPSILLTIAVTSLAIGAFVYSVKPGALPSSGGEEKPEQVESETLLAIAAPESESELSAGIVQETETEEKAAETEADVAVGKKAEPKEPVKPESEMESGPETETETETETEAEAGILRQEDGPAFSTDGITVSASLDVADLVEEVMPQVVSVTATSLQTVRDFFYGTQEILETDAGSGIIIDRDDQYLYIVTDAVIVNDVQDVTVGFCVKKEAAEELKDEDTVAQAEVMGIDEESLLAVIRVAEDQINETVLSAVKTAVLGDSDQIRVGEKVFAIGNAMGRGLSVTQGIVSAVKRSMRYGAADHELIQTDASINYGNYGGALLNADGEVIGINAGKITENASEGMGFAYPVNDAKEAISRMLEKTGAGAVTETEESKDAAAKEKAQTGEETEEAKHTLTLALAEEESESSSPDKEKESETQPAEEQIRMPESEDTKKEEAPSESEKAGTEPAAATDDQGQLGIQVGEFSKEDQIIYRIPAGVVVAVVSEGSGAQAAQLAAGDLITGINDTRVESVGELKEALSGLKRGDKVKVSFLRPDSDGVYHKDKETEVTVTLQ